MSDTLRTSCPEPPASAGTYAHVAWQRSVARSWRQHLEGGPALSILERRYGVKRERVEAIAAEFGIVGKPGKRRKAAA